MKTNALGLDAQALQDRILDLAVRGELVQQNLKDKPATALLDTINSEKSKLIKEKKIKKSKSLPEITKEEIPFNIPSSWQWVRLGNINTYQTHTIYPSKTPEQLYELYSVPNYPNGQPEITEGENIKSGKQCVKENDILLCKINPRINRVWVVNNFTKNVSIASTEWIVVRQSNISSDYLRYALMSPFFRSLMQQNISGVGGSLTRAKPKIVKTYLIPLPPLEEQKRIAAKISQLFEQIDKIESASQQYTELQSSLRSKVLEVAMHGKLVKQDSTDESASVLLDKIKAEKDELIKEKKIRKSKPLPEITEDEKPFDIPESWKWVRLGDIGVWAAGATPSRNHPEYYGGNIPWLKTGDLTDGVVDTTSEKITELGVKNSSVKLNKPGNVLIAMYGATIGKLGIVGGREIVTNQACCGCSLFEGISNWYLFYYLLASRKRLIELGSGGAQPNISKNKIENFVFPLPPLEEQKRIVNKIEKVFSAL